MAIVRASAGVLPVADERTELDLTLQADVRRFFEAERPEVVIMAAARVGGIHANNSRPATFIRDNLLIQDNVIDAAQRRKSGSSCSWDRAAFTPNSVPNPSRKIISHGPLEPTNEWYAIARSRGEDVSSLLAGIRVQRDFLDADLTVWARRQLRSAELVCSAGPDTPFP